MSEYVKPEFKKDAFNCPHCGAYSQIKWHEDKKIELRNSMGMMALGYCFAQCTYCYRIMCFVYQPFNGYGLLEGTMVYPKQKAISPTKNMPEKIKKIYEEASLVLGDSPRASCALLRLALQELMIYLRDNHEEYSDLKGENINNDISILVKNHNLSAKIQKALDVVRITGNNAVHHPKELDINDNPGIAEKLFKMINLIIEEMITKPKEVEELFQEMPQGAKDAISKRDQ